MITEKKKPKDQIFLEELIEANFQLVALNLILKISFSSENTAKNYGLATFYAKSKWAMLRIRLITDAALSLQKRKICFALYWNTKAKWYM